MKLTLGKLERLKSRKLIEKLFAEGKSVKKFPLRMVFLQTSHTSTFPMQAGFSVPKRNFKRAVDRNRLKRLLRETYRLRKEILYTKLEKPTICMISYIGKEEISFEEMYSKMTILLQLLLKETKNTNEKQ
ncbi:MAG: ribonuclease P protein component [Flavobacteriia bacterium]|nr:ribonuclease P protein component [Flavobacteriia bacterium]OIP46347.1 MAG: ribonuclease P protein component [Flavobacteriaceae bacterium CG2_30_31_66]PIV95713.1 MAG: ribonuclease P protein component [Flavobacteriaceae bacterium CG17_big_fil_post_rev_8_21_14_2_50_31_13]PIX12866.1 MAG: ribonuclease P protein component [Flavobacteriaceae bacterium CG_4_8_14_3_um_filter_31_8]PIY15612.1 MAG: ribonuclease P protein component [Flavobacteriaceae bacterium CG_4_10_14_3_um_filter_31_253]PIZ09283.1 MA